MIFSLSPSHVPDTPLIIQFPNATNEVMCVLNVKAWDMMWEDNEFFEEIGSATRKEGSHIAKEFKYLGTTLTNQ